MVKTKQPTKTSEKVERLVRDYLNDNTASEETITRELLDESPVEDWIHIREQIIELAIDYYGSRLNLGVERSYFQRKMESLEVYKERVGCTHPVTLCQLDKCGELDPTCQANRIRSQIERLIQLFEVRRNRSQVMHLAIELLFTRVLKDSRCISVILMDKSCKPRVFVNDGSKVSNVAVESARKLAKAVKAGDFVFSKDGEMIVHHQRFPIDDELVEDLRPFRDFPEIQGYFNFLRIKSVGFEVGFEKMILSILYVGELSVNEYFISAIQGIRRIMIETDPETRLREGHF